MTIDDSAPTPPAELREMDEKQRPAATVNDRSGRTRVALGGLLALLVLAAAVYYIAGYRTGSEVATAPSPNPSPESSTAATQPRAVESADRPAASTTSPQPPAPQVPSPTSAEAMPKTPPAATAPAAATRPSTASGSQPATAQTPAVAQQPMRDQPAALPEPAAAPKNDLILIVKRGPANMRSAPGKGGRLIGTVAKDVRLKEISRSGSWVEVETESGRGWISASLLAPFAASR